VATERDFTQRAASPYAARRIGLHNVPCEAMRHVVFLAPSAATDFHPQRYTVANHFLLQNKPVLQTRLFVSFLRLYVSTGIYINNLSSYLLQMKRIFHTFAA